jgi:hypothetical protein
MISMTIDELYRRRSVQALITATAEREALEHARCGSLATFDGFEDALAQRLLEAFDE